MFSKIIHVVACISGGGLVAKSCLTLATPWAVAHQAPLSMGLSRQEYWSGLPCPPPGDLPDPGTELSLLHLLNWQTGSLLLAPPGKSPKLNNLLISRKHFQKLMRRNICRVLFTSHSDFCSSLSWLSPYHHFNAVTIL